MYLAAGRLYLKAGRLYLAADRLHLAAGRLYLAQASQQISCTLLKQASKQAILCISKPADRRYLAQASQLPAGRVHPSQSPLYTAASVFHAFYLSLKHMQMLFLGCFLLFTIASLKYLKMKKLSSNSQKKFNFSRKDRKCFQDIF